MPFELGLLILRFLHCLRKHRPNIDRMLIIPPMLMFPSSLVPSKVRTHDE